ncbi:MAG: hypothetical protein ABIG95_05860 [Candidatus Woesearchaeota archaeon]
MNFPKKGEVDLWWVLVVIICTLAAFVLFLVIFRERIGGIVQI